MFEFNGEIFYKVFEVGRIPSYMDPSKKYNEEYINQVAKNYDPVNVHEAPFWVGHPDWSSEPRAGGWIKKVIAIGKEMYVSFSEISSWLKELYDSGEFKKCSVEMGDLEINSDGVTIPYLWALGATNIPAVKGLPVLKFKDKKYQEEKLLNKVSFSLLNFGYDNQQNKSLKIKNKIEMDSLKKLADSLGITLAGEETAEAITELIEKRTSELKASESEAQKNLEKSKNESAAKLIEDAIKDGKITPALKDEYMIFAKADFSSCEKIISALPANDLTNKSDVTKGKSFSADTSKVKLSDLTYEDIIRTPGKFIGVLSEDDVMKLKEKSMLFKDTQV